MKNILSVLILLLLFLDVINAQPLNDDCTNATLVHVNPPFSCPDSAVIGTTVGATFSGIQPQCSPGNSLQDVWYAIIVNDSSPFQLNITFGTASGELIIEPFGSCTDTFPLDGNCISIPGDVQIPLTGPLDFLLKITTNTNSGGVPGTFGICLEQVFTCDFMELSFAKTEASGPGNNDGAIDLSVITGLPPYSYLWSTGATTQDISGLGPGVYSVTVTGDSCVKTGSVTIVERPGNDKCVNAIPLVIQPFGACPANSLTGTTLNASASGFDPSCEVGGTTYPDVWYTFNSGNHTQLQIEVTPGTAGLATFELFSSCGNVDISLTPYCISDFGNIQTIVSGFPGIPTDYYLRVWSDSGATGTFDICLSDPINPCDSFHVSIVDSNVSVFGANDGSADLTVIGGSPPYIYQWSNGDSTEDISGLGPGDYFVTVVSSENCTATGFVNITEPPENPCDVFGGILLSGTDASALGASDAKIDLTVFGANPPILYSWSNGAASQDLNGITAGNYSVTVVTGDSCIAVGSIIISEPSVAQCTPDPNNTNPGFSPADNMLPCIENGVFYEQTIQFKNLDSIDGGLIGFPGNILPVISMQITSVFNLPEGINFRCNNYPSCLYNGGETGCFLVSGTSFDDAGSYELNMSATLTVLTGTGQVTVGVDSQTLASAGILGYRLTVIEFGDTCAFVPSCVTQDIALNTGWNMVSSYINPDDPNVLSIISDITSNILLIKNGLGQATIPAFGINGIGNWQVTEGYKVKASTATTLTIGCEQLDPLATPVNLPMGWSIAAYLRDTPMDLAVAVGSIASDILLVKNNLGDTYIPAFGINTIGDMIPGQGYKFKMSNAAMLTYPANAKTLVSSTTYRKPKKPTYYELSLNTGRNATIVVPVSSVDQILDPEDEIGVFNYLGRLVGSAVYERHNLAITVWGDDEATRNEVEGLIEGENYSYRIWHSSNQHELEVKPLYEEGSGFYADDGFSVLKTISVVGESDLGINVTSYPNPTTGLITFDVRAWEGAALNITIFNILGKQIAEFTGESDAAGIYKMEFDTGNLAIGRYIYSVKANGQMLHRNFVITR